MKAPLFDDILRISQEIAEASANEKDEARTKAYTSLIKLCASNENSPKDHPLQWEALGDFTLDADQAIDIYQKGLDCAVNLSLINAKASIYLAMAQRYEEMEEAEKVAETKGLIAEMIEQVPHEELKAELQEYLAAK